MLFSRVVSFLVFFMTLGGFALAKPTTERRNMADIMQVVTNLKSSTDWILPQIQGLSANKNVTEAMVNPLMDQLVAAFDNAHDSLSGISSRDLPSMPQRRQAASDVAQPIADIIKETVTTLQILLDAAANNPGIKAEISKLDLAMKTFLHKLGGLIPGLLNIISNLVSYLLGLLSGLGLGLLLGLLVGNLL